MKVLLPWFKLIFGAAALTSLVWFLSLGYTPPGMLGEVIRHNQAHNIDASPLFYSEVENMSELEAGLKELLQESKAGK